MCIPGVRPSWAWSRPQGEGIDRNQRNNPMQLHMHRASKCRARTRSGQSCQSPAMPNGRCRMHGGMSPGAPKGNKNAFKHGRYTAEEIANRREIAKLLRDARACEAGELGSSGEPACLLHLVNAMTSAVDYLGGSEKRLRVFGSHPSCRVQ